jgi:2-keto-myo-inositol isomerase
MNVERLAMVHLNDAPAKPPREIEDADRLLPTLGVIRLRDLVAQLTARGYQGPWSLETFNPEYWSEDPAEVARRGRELTERVIATSTAA